MQQKKPDLDSILNKSEAHEEVLIEKSTPKKEKPKGLVKPKAIEKADIRVAMYFTKTKSKKIDQLLELQTGITEADKGYKKARQKLLHDMLDKELRRNGIAI